MGCHSLLQGNLPDPGIESGSPALQVDSLLTEPSEKCYSNLHSVVLAKEQTYRSIEQNREPMELKSSVYTKPCM